MSVPSDSGPEGDPRPGRPPLRFRPLAESAVLVELGDAIDPATAARAAALADALRARDLPGVADAVPAYTTVMVVFDPTVTDGPTVAAAARALDTDVVPRPGRVRRFPVCYGGEFGPDLAEVAAGAGLTPGEVVRLHSGASYRVACMGFAPGFGYLLGLPAALHTPRRATPRTRVPVGSVALGGAQAGIYSLETPGGWHVLGRTPISLFDPAAREPVALRPGDEVRFVPVDRDAYERIARETVRRPAPGPPPPDPGAPALEVVVPGAQTTAQDLGRPGQMRTGVTPGGAVDRGALVLGNRLVGNAPATPGLECALVGPTLRFRQDTVVALTGADSGATLDGAAVPTWEPFRAGAGQVLALGMPRDGLRAYVCVAGGIAVPEVLGGRGTDLFGRFGGWHGRALAAGDLLPLGEPADGAEALLRRRLADPARPRARDLAAPLRVVLGPQEDRFTAEGIAAFLGGDYRVSPQSDRMGIRLRGEPVTHGGPGELVSEGIAAGAVQVPRDGQPIVLLAARQTVGGYPKVATVIGADLDRLGQARPGDALRFAAVDVAAARQASREEQSRLGRDSVVARSGPVGGWSPGPADGARRDGGKEADMATTASGNAAPAQAWTPQGVAELVERARAAGVAGLALEIAPLGLRLDLRWGDAPAPTDRHVPPGLAAGPDDGASVGVVTVPAPLLGVFYRRSGPGEPAFAEEGAAVRAGQAIGLVEVMKSYHEVTAPADGTLVRFLAADGAFVEYGAPLAELRVAEA